MRWKQERIMTLTCSNLKCGASAPFLSMQEILNNKLLLYTIVGYGIAAIMGIIGGTIKFLENRQNFKIKVLNAQMDDEDKHIDEVEYDYGDWCLYFAGIALVYTSFYFFSNGE